jgi:acetate kinase
MSSPLLTLNAGSSSLKFAAYNGLSPESLLVKGQVSFLNDQPTLKVQDRAGRPVAEQTWRAERSVGHADAAEYLLKWLTPERLGGKPLAAAGHRVVHGGQKFAGPVRIDPGVVEALQRLVPLAPLHQPPSLSVIDAVARSAPTLPQVACFDTAFHCTQPPLAQAFALPRKLSDSGVRRYGFHGLSFEYIAQALPQIDAATAAGRTIVAHLGHGSSLCAMKGGRSIATTMGFSALDGLVMGTRCGSIDPGVLLYFARQGMSTDQIEQMLYHESGLLGVSYLSGDMRTLLESDDPRAAEAVELFVYRAAREIGSMAAALGGIDALVFTGGIGENAPKIRAGICEASRWLGVEIDDASNTKGGPRITGPGRASAWVIPTNEELMIARHTYAVLDLV